MPELHNQTFVPIILRYYLIDNVQQNIQMPAGSTILSIGYYNEQLALFALVPNPYTNDKKIVSVIMARPSFELPQEVKEHKYFDYIDHDSARLHVFIKE